MKKKVIIRETDYRDSDKFCYILNETQIALIEEFFDKGIIDPDFFEYEVLDEESEWEDLA